MSSEQVDFKTRWQTSWILVAIIVLLIAWDVYAGFFTAGAGDTISEVTLFWARRHPIVPFIVGGINFHLFWPQQVRMTCEKCEGGLK